MSDTIVIYHADCIDGFTAAWSFWMVHPEWEYYPAKHGYPAPDVTGKYVYFLDFSYKKPVLEDMLKTAKHITIIDHHKSTVKELEDFYHINLSSIFDMNKSGASLAWKYVNKIDDWEEIPSLIRYIEDYDLWRFKYKNTKRINSYLGSQPYDFNVWSSIYSTFEEEDADEIDTILAIGESLINKQTKDVNFFLTKKFRYVIGEIETWLVNAPFWLASDIGHELSLTNPFGATYYYDGQKYIFSLRSNESNPECLDVSEIARTYGGGGHRNAAGFELASPLLIIDPKRLENAYTLIDSKPELISLIEEFNNG